MKNLLTKLTPLFVAAFLFFTSVPSFATVTTVTERSYSGNGILTDSRTLQYEGSIAQAKVNQTAHYDSQGRFVSGIDDSKHLISRTYDQFGDVATDTGWDGKQYATTYYIPVTKDGVSVGTVTITKKANDDGSLKESYDTVKGQLNNMTAALKGGDINLKNFFGTNLISFGGTGAALMETFGSEANLAKIFKLAWDAANADVRAKADADAKKAFDAAANPPSETYTYDVTTVNQDPAAFAHDIWAEMSKDPDCTVQFSFGSFGDVTKVVIDHPQGKQVTLTPSVKTDHCTLNGTDPIITGQASIAEINGKYYLAVQATSINMFQMSNYNDENAFAEISGDGETIYVELDATDKATAEAMLAEITKGGGTVTIAGDVINSPDGSDRKFMKMNAGGYAAGANAEESQQNWISKSGSQKFYSDTVMKMKDTWDAASDVQKSDWTNGWNYLLGLAS